MFKHKILSLAILTVLAGATSALANQGSQQPSCTQQTIRGSWMYTCEGALPTPNPTPTRMLGTCTASQTAYWTCQGTVNLGGGILAQALQGQANNLPNCDRGAERPEHAPG